MLIANYPRYVCHQIYWQRVHAANISTTDKISAGQINCRKVDVSI